MKKVSSSFVLLLFIITTARAADEIVINEIMYNSDGDDVEFVEIYNASSSAMNLQDWYLLDDNDGHAHCLLTGTLQPGEYLVIAGNITLFQQKYPGVININPNDFDTGIDAWRFGNGGDVVRLFESSGGLHDSVPYDDGGTWPGSPDGGGPSLELLYPALDNSNSTSWDPSSVPDGTPGVVNSVFTNNVPPTCKDGERQIGLPASADAVPVTVLAFDIEGLDKVELFVDSGTGYVTQAMNDNGVDGDAVAGDSIFTSIISPTNTGTLIKYYARAMDSVGQEDDWPNNAPEEYHAYTVDYTPPKLRINEVLALNNSTNSDEAGEFDDWFEIYNADNVTVNLGGMYVSTALNTSRAFELPTVNLAAGEYLVVWADRDTEQGSLHADFRLSANGESIALFETIDHGNVLIHGWKYGLMSADVSMGYFPEDGSAPEYLTIPTPGASNDSSHLLSQVCINEFQSTSAFGGPQDDWIEIYNRSPQAFDLTGCFLSDERGDNTKWTFPQTILQPGEYLVIFEDVLNFGFSSDGDDVIMFTAADSVTGLDFYDFGPQQADISEGRFPDGTNSWNFFAMPTPGTVNTNPTSVDETPQTVPEGFSLFQNYPNPFNPETVITYSLPQQTEVNLTVFNLLGQMVFKLVDKKQDAGSYTVQWNGMSSNGLAAASGVYIYKLSAADFSTTRKMLLLR